MMVTDRIFRLIYQPRKVLAEAAESPAEPIVLVIQTAILALIPTFCGYVATVRIGWDFGVGEPLVLPPAMAAYLAIAAYVAFNVGVYAMGFAIFWLAQTFAVKPDPLQCLELAVLTSVPLFLTGIMALYPVLYIDIIVGMVAIAAAIFLLYTGVPVFMRISKEAGFIYSTWIAALGLIMLVVFLGLSVFVFSGLT